MKKKLLIIFRLLSVIIICICLYQLYKWNLENQKNKDLKDDLISNYLVEDTSNSTENIEENLNTTLQVDFEKLLKTNSDTVGWIRISNTEVNYPIVQSNNNDFYLTHNFDQQYNSAGWIFADFRNRFETLDKNTVIYGHNRRNNSMFGTLKNTLNQDWYTNTENHHFDFYTIQEKYTAQIFSIFKIKTSEFVPKFSFSSDEDFMRYIQDMRNKSIYHFPTTIEPTDNIITLYTCDNNTNYRIIICAKLANP